MGQYKFRLQKLLDIRIDKEEESKRNFKEAQSEKLKIEEKLNGLKKSYEKYRGTKNGESITQRKLRHVYLNAIGYTINVTTEELKKKEKVLQDKLLDLKEKQISRKVVETLREKQEKAFLKEEGSKEQKMNDEFALYAYIRNFERR